MDVFSLVIFILLLLIFSLSGVLSSVIIAFIIAYVFDPVIDWFEAHKFSRTGGIVTFFTLFLGVIILFFIFVTPVFQKELSSFTEKIPSYMQSLQKTTIPFVKDYLEKHPDQVEYVKEKLQNFGFQLLKPVVNFFKSVFSGVINLILKILDLLLIPVLAFYLLKDIDKITEGIKNSFPEKYRDTIIDIFSEIDYKIKNFLKGQLIVSVILAIIYSIGLWIFNVPLAFVIGIVAGLANIIPYLGIAIGLIPALILSYLDSHSYVNLLGVIGTFAVAQALEGTIISPRVVGEKVGLHPVMVIVAILLGGHFFGFVGILVAVPAASIVLVIFSRAYKWYIESNYFKGDA
ncbi:phosphoribosylaminoimidazole-succinocarboxamide synthase [Thermotomaculum hydrothermale]|uniref:Phosphoribosylaminoimidazole-succinocarboxamide synthase n=1 Tax=Thermotomaculum hydrothermale TaxID=981385 RepID=A0A7R6SXK9_9BACT|nr:AI-2E family transporter [Thermotomaculum hydrothermale]BBB31660.1 phosphoribosylaminoimidazole-succinocarboxamide synthase [Thermotomaculum hydrothermale]